MAELPDPKPGVTPAFQLSLLSSVGGACGHAYCFRTSTTPEPANGSWSLRSSSAFLRERRLPAFAVATRLDGFTVDEAYHIAAGVSYVRYADFRINPEHPPLVKLWVGSLISATGFHLSGVRPFADKDDERNFAEQDVYLNNNFDSVQKRARIAMWMLNGFLLVVLAFAIRRIFGPGAALGTLLFLAIDPTIAAHLPVVMTDLPVSLLCAAAVTLAIRGFRDWAPPISLSAL